MLADVAAAALGRIGLPVLAVGLPPTVKDEVRLALADDLALGRPAGWQGRLLYCVRSLNSIQLTDILRQPDAYVTVIDDPDTSLEESVRSALAGHLRLPPSIERTANPRVGSLTAEQVGWFQLLAAGWRVIDIAMHTGFSERELHRRLRTACRQLQVTSRIEAIVVLARLGLVG